MEVDAQGRKSQQSGTPFPYPFTHAPQYPQAPRSVPDPQNRQADQAAATALRVASLHHHPVCFLR